MRYSFSLLCGALLAGFQTFVPSANAAVMGATSKGYGMSVGLSALGLNLNAGPLPTGQQGTAPNPYNVSGTTLNVNTSSNIPVVISGLANASSVSGAAFSNVDGLLGSRTTSASGGVVGAQIGMNTIPVIGDGVTLLGLNGTLNSTAQITGDADSLLASGTTTIQSLGLTINGIGVNLAPFVGVSVAPNTSINLAALGIANSTLILNEQIIAPDQSSITVNAFHLTLNLVSLIGGDVTLGHSEVQLTSVTAVPEPVGAASIGLGMLLLTIRRRTVRA